MPAELLEDPHHFRQDLRIVEQSIKRGWKIPEAALETLPEKIAAMALKSRDPRVRIAASRVLLAMNAQNIAQEKPAPIAQAPNVNVQVNIDADARRDRIREIAERIRTERIAVEPAGG